MDHRDALRKLRGLSVGGVVERVEENGSAEGLVTLFVRVGEELREIPIFATELGWWITGECTHRGGRALYASLETMLASMSTDALYSEPLVETLEDEASVGFRLTIRDVAKEYWIARSACTGLWAELALCERGRRWIAEHEHAWDAPDPRDLGPGILPGDDAWRG